MSHTVTLFAIPSNKQETLTIHYGHKPKPRKVEKTKRLTGNGKQTDYSGQDLQGGWNATQVMASKYVYSPTLARSSLTECQLTRLIRKGKQLEKKLGKPDLSPYHKQTLEALLAKVTALICDKVELLNKRNA